MIWLKLTKFLPYIAIVVALVGAGYAIYIAGGANQRANTLEDRLEQIENISEAIRDGREEVRQANPTGDPSIARERLLQRQAGR